MNKRGVETKRLIKEKAYQLFAEKGFKDVTMKDICERTGLSRGGLYGRYESTRQIFQDIIDDLMGDQDEEFSAKMAQGLPAVQILDDVLNRYKQEMLDRSTSLSVAIYEYFSMEKSARGEISHGESSCEEISHGENARGEISYGENAREEISHGESSCEETACRKHDGDKNALYEQYLLSSAMWKKLIQYGLDHKEFNDVDADAVIDLIIFSYQGVRMYSRLMPVDPDIPEHIIMEIRKIFVREG